MKDTGFRVHLLRFRAVVKTPLELPRAAGAAIRGALFGALRSQFCLAGSGPDCGHLTLCQSCPVCFLLAPVNDEARRGRDVPRPFVLRISPDAPLHYQPGDSLEFGFATFGRALSHFPYAMLGVQEIGHHGLGSRRRGTFQLQEVFAEIPFSRLRESVYVASEGPVVHPPSLCVSATEIDAEVARLRSLGGDHRLALDLLTPTRLITGQKLVKPESFTFRVLAARLVERLEALVERYASASLLYDPASLLACAKQVRIASADLHWRELFRASGRHQRMLPMSGLIGRVLLEGDLTPYLPLLVWGSLTHVGKDAAMGNGMFRISPI